MGGCNLGVLKPLKLTLVDVVSELLNPFQEMHCQVSKTGYLLHLLPPTLLETNNTIFIFFLKIQLCDEIF